MNTHGFMLEEWKEIPIDIECTNKYRMEISNLGRVRSYNSSAEGKILKGSLTEGYKVIRLKLYKPREEKDQVKFDLLKAEISKLFLYRRQAIAQKKPVAEIEALTAQIESQKKNLSKKLAANLKKRTINYHFLVHRMVAQCFLPPPQPDQTVVAHLDYNKLNNRANNLKWMSLDENKLHQAKNPALIQYKDERKNTVKYTTQGHKLNVTQVMLIKKRIKENIPLKQIAKQFKISEMQVSRIKRGENWAHVRTPE